MLLHPTQPLFAWDALDDSPSLGTIKRVLATIPDQPLLDSLRQHRGKGRDDCPLHVLWGVIVLTILLRHPTFEACLAELVRNDDLRVLIGLPRDDENAVPKAWNISRFLEVLGQPPHLQHLRAVFDHMVQRLGQVVPDLGTHCAGDATALNARRSRDTAAPPTPTPAPRVGSAGVPSSAPDAAAGARPLPNAGRAAAPPLPHTDPTQRPATAQAAPLASAGQATPAAATDAANDPIASDRHGLPLAAGGRKEYRDDEGRVTKVVTWFGYKCHLLVDVKHEVSLAYRISSTKAGDNEELPDLVRQGQANLPAGRIRTLAYDKAADDEAVHEFLYEQGIEPVIQQRSLWKGESERLLPGHDGTSNIVYNEAGTVYCYDKVSEPPVQHRMAYIGHEPERGTLKYRCPAKHEGWTCPMSEICNAGKSYGKTVRIKQEEDLRRFPPIPRATKQFERLYKGRTAVERVNARLKIYWGADDGNLVGAPRFHGFLGTVMVVHVALATVLASLPRREGTLGKMKLSPIAAALQEQLAAGQPAAVP
jgi:Transposase DDE domain